MRRFLQLVFLVCVPVILIVGAVRIVSWPWFAAWEYARAGFPEDPLGMSVQERFYLARSTILFLNLPTDLSRLARLELPDGSPAYNQAELQHMLDVKRLYDGITNVALLAVVVAAITGWSLMRRGAPAACWGALSSGALLTLILLVGVGILMLLSWNEFFTAFHDVFFEPGTWQFAYTDTLIRLFPMRFWRDAGLLVVGLVSATALGMAFIGRVFQHRLEESGSEI